MFAIARQGRQHLVRHERSLLLPSSPGQLTFLRSMSVKKPAEEPKTNKPKEGNPVEFRHDYSVQPDTYSYTTEMNEDNFYKFPQVTAKKLARRKERPRNVRMLSRDFIDDSLYHPDYGYFSKEVEIFTPEKPFNYNNINDVDEFMLKWTDEYKRYEDTPAQNPQPRAKKGARNGSRQLWHTPTELFKPFYGEALARYLLVNYKLSLYPYHDLTIYEMGGGNGTLMLNILDYIRETQPDVYSRTRYNIIEISPQLASKQQHNLMQKASSRGHAEKVDIINKSIFEWKNEVLEPCFFIALEVFDNFAHDVIRYDNTTLQPYQANVVIDKNGDFQEIYSPNLDPWAKQFLQLREEVGGPNATWTLGVHPLAQPGFYRRLKNQIYPFRGNLSDPEYIPTRYLQFLHILKTKFPEHRLLTSDFTHLPNTSPGYNAPVVQTVLDNTMVPVSSYMVLQGFFDILFPTDFELAAELYRKVCNKLIKTDTHHDFLEQWADVESTTTKQGENPMLSFYRNAAFMYS